LSGFTRQRKDTAVIEKMKEALGFRATGRKIICADDTFELREVLTPYGKAKSLDSCIRGNDGMAIISCSV
jgi:hypothetical protein